MKKDTIVQFVCFETTVAVSEFIPQWEEYNKLINTKQDFVLQLESDGKSNYRYLSQHCCYDSDYQFVFKKGRRSAHFPEVEMRVKEAGGYTALQMEYSGTTQKNGSKIFVFLTASTDLDVYKNLSSYQYLNIYQAYYESCAFINILEFFVENIHVNQLVEQLKMHNRANEMGVYKECNETKKSKTQKPQSAKKVMI